MAKKLLAILLAITMVVPMVLSQAFAADASGSVSYTVSEDFDGDSGHGYSQIPNGHYPDKAYHLMTRVVIDYIGSGAETHGSISWVNGTPNSAYGFDFATGKAFVAMTGWNGQVDDSTNFLAQEDCTLAEGEYYQFDWYVSDTEIKGYVNGDLVIDYVGSGLWTAGGYIISYPYDCGYEVLDYVVTAQDNSATYCANLDGWSFSEGDTTSGWGQARSTVDYTVDTYEIIDWQPYADAVEAKIAAIGTVGYNEWVSVTDTNSMSYEAAAGWGPYTDVQEGLNAPSRIEMDVQLVENKDGESLVGGFPHNGGGAFLGYNVDAGKFYIAENRGYGDFDTKYAIGNAVASTEGTITLDTTKAYTIGLVYGADYVAIEFQGKEVLRSTAYSFASGDIHLPVVNAKFNFLGYRVYLLSSGALTQEDNWSKFSSNATLGRGITCTADMFVNSGAAITAAEEAYAALPAEAQALVSNYATLTAARTAYDAKVQAVAQAEADGLIAKIDTIGTVTLEDQALIAECEEEYSNMDPVVQALVSNYATLTDARAQYNAYVSQKAALEAKIDSIGTVYYQQETNRDSDYDNTGFRFNYRDGDGYSTLKVNDTTQIPFDYRMQFDFQVNAVEAGNSYAQLAGGAQNFCVGYDFTTQRFVLVMEEGHGGDHSPWTNLDPEDANAISVSDVFPILPDCVYNWDLQVKGNRVTLYIDGVKMVELANGTSENTCRKDGNYFIFYPRGCVVSFANFNRYIDVGSGWVTWYEASQTFGAGPDNFSGQDLINNTRIWGDRGAGYGNTVVALHADAILDDGALIAECEADYADLDEYGKSIISNYATLTAARTTYDALQNDPAVGAVIALINDIGEVTLESGDAIAAAEAAYADLSAAQQAQVSNYADLTAARTAYDALVAAKERADRIAAVEAAIDDIGTVFYLEDPTAVDMGIETNFPNQNDMAAYVHVGGRDLGDLVIEYDFVPVSNYTTTNAFFGFGCGNGAGAGYSYSEQKWFITTNAQLFGTAARQLDVASETFPLEANTLYHVRFEMNSGSSAIYVDGVKVVESDSIGKTGYTIFMPQGCSYRMTNLTITEDGTALCSNVKGNDLLNVAAFPLASGYNTKGIVPMLVDSEAAILDARSAYDALSADEKADVSNYATLEAAEARYAELANPTPAITYGDANGDDTIDIGDVIVLAQYLVDDSTEIADGADANGDGVIDISDVILLAQYLVDEGTILGPQA